MTKNNNIIKQITNIGVRSFEKLQELNVPPYPKYYYDTFMNELESTNNTTLIDLSKKYSHLFSTSEHIEPVEECSFEMAKASLKEFEASNIKLKKISNENIVDISSIKNEYERIDAQEVINTFDSFQNKILFELKSADETISKLKLEIERLEKESHIDPLTKAYNRRVFSKDIKEIIEATANRNIDMFLVIFDADDFKNINDSYGHLAGDKTLIFLTKLIQNSIRKGTKVYRYGGEEFIIIFNRVTLEEAKKTVDRIIKETSESKLLYKGHNIHLTISAGIAPLEKNDTAEKLIEKADKALYEAKYSGKNCFKVSN